MFSGLGWAQETWKGTLSATVSQCSYILPDELNLIVEFPLKNLYCIVKALLESKLNS